MRSVGKGSCCWSHGLSWISRSSVLRGDLTPEKLPLSSAPAYNMHGLKHKLIRKSRAKGFVLRWAVPPKLGLNSLASCLFKY